MGFTNRCTYRACGCQEAEQGIHGDVGGAFLPMLAALDQHRGLRARGIAEASAEPRLLDGLMVRALGDRSARVLWSAGPDGAGFVDSDGSPYEVLADIGWWPAGDRSTIDSRRWPNATCHSANAGRSPSRCAARDARAVSAPAYRRAPAAELHKR